MGKTPTREALTRRYQIKWEFLRRNKDYRKEHHEYAQDPQAFRRGRIFFPPLKEKETPEGWAQRVEGRPHWVESTFTAFLEKWNITRPVAPADDHGGKAMREYAEWAALGLTINPAIGGNLHPDPHGRAGPHPCLSFSVDVSQPLARSLHFIKKKIMAAKSDLRKDGHHRREEYSPEVLEDAIKVYELARKRKPWADIARELYPHLQGARMSRARGYQELDRLQALMKLRHKTAVEYIGGRFREL